jgi:hypothetical protein
MDRRPIKVAAVALANKIARMAWASFERLKEDHKHHHDASGDR